MKLSIAGVAAVISLILAAPAQPSSAAAQSRAAPEWTLNAQKTVLTASFPTNPKATLPLDAAEVDKMIATLAQMRAEMQPPRPIADPAPGTPIDVATVGHWWVQPDGTGADLAILHPGYGWVGLELNRTAVEELNRSLTRAIYRPPVRERHRHERR